MLGHQVGDHHAGGPAQPHVAVDSHQAAPRHRPMDKLRRPVKISDDEGIIINCCPLNNRTDLEILQ